MASYQIMYDIAKISAIKDVMYDSIVIKDEYRGLAKQYLNKSKIFFKHADKDSEEKHEFPPDINDYMLMACISLMERMKIHKNIEHSLFPWWFICTHENLVKEEFLKTPEIVLFMCNDYVKDKKLWLSILREFETFEQFQEWLKLLSTKSELQKNQEVYDIFLKPYD